MTSSNNKKELQYSVHSLTSPVTTAAVDAEGKPLPQSTTR